MPIARRSLLRTIGAGTLAAPAILRTVNAQGLRKIKFTLSWMPEGTYAFVYVAKALGAWKRFGLDVDIARGYGSLPAAQAVAQGLFDFSTGNSSAVVQLVAKGLPLCSLCLMDYNSAMGLVFPDEQPIRTPKDLEGKRIGQSMSSADAAFFAPFAVKNGVDINKITIVNLDPRVRTQALMNGEVDAITGFASTLVGAIGPSGRRVRYMLYGNYGVFLYGNSGLLTQQSRLRDDPELCQSMATGILEGLKYCLTNPDEAKQLFLGSVPELKMAASADEAARLSMAVQRYNVLSVPDAKINGLGWADLARLHEMAELVMRYQGDAGATVPDLSGVFSNQFVGGVRLSAAEWDASLAKTADVAKLLGG
jgi:ABC-type nitrate/sulfonate/bicarbonate transport system substrate-binding protein